MFNRLFCVVFLFTSYLYAVTDVVTRSNVTYDKDGLFLFFALIDNEQFFEDWQKPEPPVVSSADKIQRGGHIFPVIIFGTDSKDDNGNAYLTYDIQILKPDGSIYGDFKDLLVWKDNPASEMHLMDQQIVIRIEEDDPFGAYKVNAVIHEKNKGIDVPLNLAFEVIEGDPPTESIQTHKSIQEKNDEWFDRFTSEYYNNPNPDMVDDALLYIIKNGTLNKESAIPPLLFFFGECFYQNKEMIAEWKSTSDGCDSTVVDFVETIIYISDNPKEVLKAQDISPQQNDMCWGAFKASGDPFYLNMVVQNLEYLEERKALTLFLAAGTAEWSLASNAKENLDVYDKLLVLKESCTKDIADKIDELLQKDPSMIYQEVMDIVKEQNEQWK